MAKQENPLATITPKFRVSFPQVFEPKSFRGKPAKYSVQMLFDKSTDLAPLKAVIKKAAQEEWGEKLPKNLKLPFRQGDEKELEGYEGKIVVSAGTKFKPQVIDQKLAPIEAEQDFYPGCYARAKVVAYAWEEKDGKSVLARGVSFNLESIQKLADGESFVSRRDAAEDFDSVEDGSEDATNFESSDDSDDFEL